MSGEGAKEGTSSGTNGGTNSGTNDASAINRNVAKWVERDFNALSTISFYLKDEPLQHIANCQTSKETWDELNFIYAMGD